MKKSCQDIPKFRITDEAAINKTAQLQQALAQIEAALLRKENQKVSEKSKNM